MLHYAQQIPCADIAVAYGAPCSVADERVMVTVHLKQGVCFDPDEVHGWLTKQQKDGGMNPEWMPDYIRIIESFPVTDTQKIMVRPYKKEHFDIENNPGMVVYFRERGMDTYRKLTPEKFSEIRKAFRKNGRESLIARAN